MCQVRVLRPWEIEYDRTDVSRVDDKNSRGKTSGVFGRSGRPTSGSLQVAVKVVIVGRRWRVVQGRSNCEERRAPCHDSTNGWPLHGWNAWRLNVHYILCQCHEGRAPAALQDEPKRSRELLSSHQRYHVTSLGRWLRDHWRRTRTTYS